MPEAPTTNAVFFATHLPLFERSELQEFQCISKDATGWNPMLKDQRVTGPRKSACLPMALTGIDASSSLARTELLLVDSL